MHLSSRTDIEAPIDFVYAKLSDFDGWERAAMRRGAEVARTDKLRSPGPGMGWTIRFRFRGKQRDVAVNLTAMDPGARLAFFGQGQMLNGNLAVELMALAPKRTRLVLHAEVKPLTIGARLFLQSLRLAKARVQTKLNARLGQTATDLEARYAATARR